jgi:lysophospholipase L1-like esterase
MKTSVHAAVCATLARLLYFVALTLVPISPLRADMPINRNTISASHLSVGESARLDRVFAKARRGETVTLGYIGGSITSGASASTPDNSYASLLATWWRQRFPSATFNIVNAGVGGTGSIYGALRAQRDLLVYNPDIIVIEFAVNDGWQDEHEEAYEGLVRQLLKQPNSPAVIALFMMWTNGGNNQDMQARIGRHYGLPMVSFRDALWPDMASGRIKWSDYIVDEVHPNDAGHKVAALFISSLLDKILATSESPTERKPLLTLPEPLKPTRFESTSLNENGDLKPIRNTGWDRSVRGEWPNYWSSNQLGARITFQSFGTGIVLSYLKGRGMGKVQVSVDDKRYGDIDAGIQNRWGLIREFRVIDMSLSQKRHVVDIETVGEKDAPDSRQEFGLLAIGSIGLPR